MPQLLDFNPAIISSVNIAQNNLNPGEEIDLNFIRHLFIGMVINYNKKFRAKFGEMIVCCDSGNVWREEIFKYYKAKRKSSKADSPIRWDVVYDAIDTFQKEILELLPIKLLKVDKAEADDIIGVLCKYFENHEFIEDGLVFEPQPCLIIGRDRDYLQLQRYSHVQQFAPTDDRFISIKNPELFLKEKIIRGDSGDGVPNFLSPDDILVTPGKRQKPIMSKKLEVWLEQTPEEICEDDETLLRNYKRNEKLVDLTMVPKDIEDKIIEQYTNQEATSRRFLLEYFMKNRLKNHLPFMEYV